MGFPVAYSELLLPRVLLHVVFLLGYVRRFISWAFDTVGLGDLLDSDAPWAETATTHIQQEFNHHHHHHRGFRSVSMMLVEEALPVVRYEELASAGQHVGDSCAVCLYEFEAADRVRRLSNCRHVYHRGCLDPWLEHGQRTCPLCRTPLVGGEEARHDTSDQMWDSDGAPPDTYDDDFMMDSSFSSSLASSALLPSPTLLRPHQLFLTPS